MVGGEVVGCVLRGCGVWKREDVREGERVCMRKGVRVYVRVCVRGGGKEGGCM